MAAGREVRLAVTLAAVAGFVDAACYLTLHQLFVAHVTGDTNLLGQRLGRGDLVGAVPLAVTIVCFAVSIAVATACVEVATRRGVHSPLAGALVAEALLLALVMAYGERLVRHGTIPGRTAGGYYVLLCCAVSALGIQTAAFVKCGGRTIRTTYLSGMSTRLGQELANVLLPPPRADEPSYVRDRLGLGGQLESGRGAELYLSLVVAFVAGASFAVWCVLRIELWALALPIAALLLAAAVDGRRPAPSPAAATPRGRARPSR
jgi:uncharacterized membrane protein YoaK (UPF0700 family)